MTDLQPTGLRERIDSLDVVRGFAVLGILLMNVQSYSMIGAAYFNPVASGHFDGFDRWIWSVVHLFADQKFMTLFSMLFGAGIVLVTDRAQAAGRSPAGVHYRRTLWLLVIGILHAYLFWYGDVLVWYSLCALFVVWFRKIRPSFLLILGLLAIGVGSLISVLFSLSIPHMPEETAAELKAGWLPGADAVAKETATYQGGWLAQLEHRLPTAAAMHTVVFLVFAAWRAGGLMLVGMALYKWGIFGTVSRGRLKTLVAFGLFGGFALVGIGLHQNFAAEFSFEFSRFTGLQYNYWGSLFVSAGYLGAVLLMVQSGWLSVLQQRLAAVGRMALTNYLTQTVLCTTLFYGHGLGWFQSTSRWAMLAIVVTIWAFQLAISPWWLQRFRFGPCEWAWRSLTYWRRQPFRVAESA